MAVLGPTCLDHTPTEIVGIKEDRDREAGGGLELPDELGRQLYGLPERDY
jgi:hypothetical protein